MREQGADAAPGAHRDATPALAHADREEVPQVHERVARLDPGVPGVARPDRPHRSATVSVQNAQDIGLSARAVEVARREAEVAPEVGDGHGPANRVRRSGVGRRPAIRRHRYGDSPLSDFVPSLSA